MAFDGITVAAVVKQLQSTILGGRVSKISQPEKDELLLTIKNEGGQYRLMMSADASLPLIYLTQENKKSPLTAPGFCMLLRKHIQNGRIVAISQPGLERVIRFDIEHLDEMGDLKQKTLVMELMGKHSNIIFHDENGMILDSIKHVSGAVSTVREVLPGRTYFIPETMDKIDPISGAHYAAMSTRKQEENAADFEKKTDDKAERFADGWIRDQSDDRKGDQETQRPESERKFGNCGKSGIPYAQFCEQILQKAAPAYKALYFGFTGISPIVAQEICYRAGVDGDFPVNAMDENDRRRLYDAFTGYMDEVRNGDFSACIVYDHGEPVEFGVLPFTIYAQNGCKQYDTVSEVLSAFYAQKSARTRIRQKSVDLRKIVTTALERNIKKYDLQAKQLKDTEKREKYKVYGELLHTYGYQAQGGEKSLTVDNYYTGKKLTIPLDPTLTAMENAKKYFDKYGKLKRTNEAVTQLLSQTKDEITHLESVMNALDIAQAEGDLAQIKEELIESGYIRYKGGKKKEKIISKPMHFVSSDGFDMYVGKNNFQNEELTFQLAQGNDWWFHAKGMPGSHVIVKSGGKEMPDRTFEEAGRLAAHFSKAKGDGRIEVDYIEKKHVKKPGGGKPGFVVYYTNYSLLIDSDISGIKRLE